MKQFENESTLGNEKAIRRGKRVPEGDVNLAWAKGPALSPEENMIILDTSGATQENATRNSKDCKFYFANYMGILEDEHGNQIVQDEYPAVTDEFSIEENYQQDSFNEFSEGYILPYKHTSRYFHVDQRGITLDEVPTVFNRRPNIVVENEEGLEYLDSDGKPRYKIKLVKSDDFLPSADRNIGVYRVWAYVDDNQNESLYLRYNKVELSGDGTSLRNQNITHREILNPQPFFKYVPEETDVLDPNNRRELIYSTKPVTMKEQILNLPKSGTDGFKVYVPRKAIPDPRKFQLFRWRPVCEFQERYTVDTEDSKRTVKVGILTARRPAPYTLDQFENQPEDGVLYSNYFNPVIRAPYLFLNMERSAYNPTGIKLVNPISEDRGYTIVEDFDEYVQNIDAHHAFAWQTEFKVKLKKVYGEDAKEYMQYWAVNIDDVTNEQLKQFDVLFLWSGDVGSQIPYLNKINYFTKTLGKSIYMAVTEHPAQEGIAPKVSWPIHPFFGRNTWEGFWETPPGAPAQFALGDTLRMVDPNDELFGGLDEYGGWEFGETEFTSISAYKFHYGALYADDKSYMSVLYDVPNATPTASGKNYWKTLLAAKSPDGIEYPTLVVQRFDSGGSIFVDCAGVTAYINIFLTIWNMGPKTLKPDNYQEELDGAWKEGATKFMWNWILSSLRARTLEQYDDNDTDYASTWRFEGPWQASWVIDGEVLTEEERRSSNFAFEPKDITQPQDFVWRRKLSNKTMKEMIDEEMVKELGQDYLRQVAGATRSYSIEVTNTDVEVPTTLRDGSNPYAWTQVYSPPFNVPQDFGPHIIKDDPIVGRYEAGQYIHKSYPPQKYNVKVNANYDLTTQSIEPNTTTITAWFKATEILEAGAPIRNDNVNISWASHGSGAIGNDRYNTKIGMKNYTTTNRNGIQWGSPYPNAIMSINDLRIDEATSFPYMGIVGNFDIGSSGEIVRYIQYALNRLHGMVQEMLKHYPSGNPWGDWGLRYRLPGRTLTESGIYDQATKDAVKAFQEMTSSRNLDGVADTEFFSKLGSQIMLWGIEDRIYWFRRSDDAIVTWGPWVPPDPNLYYSLRFHHFDQNEDNYLRYNQQPFRFMDLRNLSDQSNRYSYIEVSDSKNPVDKISNIFLVQFVQSFNIHTVSLTPALLGGNTTCNIDFVDACVTRVNTAGLSPEQLNRLEAGVAAPFWPYPVQKLATFQRSQATMANLNIKAKNGERTDIKFNPRRANTLIIGVSQDQPMGGEFGNIKSLGVSDISCWGFVAEGGYSTRIVRDYIGFIKLTKTITTNKEVIFTVAPQYAGPGYITDVRWGYNSIAPDQFSQAPAYPGPSVEGYYRIESSNDAVIAEINEQGTVIMRHTEVINNSQEGNTEGRWLPAPPDTEMSGEVYYMTSRNPGNGSFVGSLDIEKNPVHAMDENGRLYPGVEVGTIRKTDGIKLLCTKDKKPIGIPPLPTGVGPNEAQRHFVDLTIETASTSPLVKVAFYDFLRKEFIVNEDGTSALPYIEYVARGPQNIYVGLITEAETVEKLPYPPVDDSTPKVPFKWAMPVYGLCAEPKSKIAIEPLPKDLGPTDLWYIPIKTGHFDKVVQLPNVNTHPLTGWVSNYQGQQLQGFYSVPESELMGWSPIYGRPATDVRGENPIVINENIIQVKQAPILMANEPTPIPSLADPCRPVLRVYTRPDVLTAWTEVPMTDIIDYNVSDGTVYLRNPLEYADSDLVKVDYTSLRKVYAFKESEGRKINLNPYPGHRRDLVGVPIYVYVLPEYVKDLDGNLIEESINERTLRISTDNSVFNPLSPEYNPLAVELGIVFISPSLDINDLVLLDTRRRGGGAKDSSSLKEIRKLVDDSVGYWDIGFGAGQSYQRGGFVVVRLPKMLKVQFPNSQDIIDVIRRNITAGVEFEIEDLEGQAWDG